MTTRGTNPNPASTQKPQATTVNLKTQKLRLECQHNVTLDYSFKQIRDIADIIREEPRKGKGRRKPIPKLEEEVKEDEKAKNPEPKETKKQEEKADQESPEGGDNAEESPNGEGEKKNEEEKENEQKPEEDKTADRNYFNTKDQVEIKIIPETRMLSSILVNNAVQSAVRSSNIGGFKLVDEGKEKQNRRIKVETETTALILSYNVIGQIKDIYNVVDQVMFEAREKLQWLDLSHNYLETLTTDLCKFENLHAIYLDCNYIRDLLEFYKLKDLKHLRTLTVFGNPVDQLPGFRTCLIGMLPTLKTLDTVVVSKKEFDNATVWFKTFNKKVPKFTLPSKKKFGPAAKKKDGDESPKTLQEAYPHFFPPKLDTAEDEVHANTSTFMVK